MRGRSLEETDLLVLVVPLPEEVLFSVQACGTLLKAAALCGRACRTGPEGAFEEQDEAR